MPPVRKPKRQLRRTFLREWREHLNITQEQAAESLNISRSLLSKIENAQSPYSQGLIEAASDYYGVSVASLLMRNPLIPDAVWSIHDNLEKASEPVQREISDFISFKLGKTGTND
ncbi:helix-turn-helix domain-containing protein [Pseudohoeflea coraliihabitans]|uniref:Helix-turn-helix transcriptional regulator n=1 Tax=Pseudohoeflea coraliihabitans TaxID=2860393 RepID=A0ABS6WIB3_9HYPH|nr:helix-turn-helix transcriptional regulator [Pseudohoeflea sp. DP4N28-3]MBW3095666.1 helix-turn-helix transcriptional regulator [Pseudohoeflea sp. DP4N28-3]